MNILITICARGGSKGIPGKNIKPLCGKPLIGYTIDVARVFQSKHPHTTIALSTDSEAIRSVASQCGLVSSYVRPESLAGDAVGKVDAIADVVRFAESENNIRYDYILDMDVTSPLRNLADLEAAFAVIQADPSALNLFSVSPSSRSPYFNMVEQKENGYFDKVKSVGQVFARQAAPIVYDLNASFYIYTKAFFDEGLRGAITSRSLIYEMQHTCFDLDHPLDFEIIEFLIGHNKLDFEL
ncbi:MAG: acylneuraminate cytidylyltransferase family protein [Mucinivorans sp.]